MLKQARVYIVICVIAIIQYGNTFQHDYAWDDAIVVTQNDRVQQGLSDPAIFFQNIKSDEIQHRYGYRPVSLLSFALDIELSEMTPKTGHVMNTLYYALLCSLIFYFLRRMFPRKGALFAMIVVGLFLIHPVHVEVVANIKSRDEILAMIFGISSLIFMLNFLERERNKILNASLLIFMLVLSFLSKENGITFVGLLWVVAYFRSTEKLQTYMKYALPVLGGLILLGIRYYVYSDAFFENNVTELLETNQYKEDGFIGNPLHDANGFFELLPNVFNILMKSLGLIVFPVTLVHDYGFSHSTMVGWTHPTVIISVLFHLGLLYVVIREFRKKSVLLFGILFYFITLSVYLHIVQVGPDYMGERFLFAPSLGAIIAIVVLIERITKASFDSDQEPIWKNGKAKVALGVLAVFFLMGCVKTLNRNKAWENNRTLFETDIVALEDCARTQYNYAVFLHDEYYKSPTQQKQADILYHYQRAVDISDRSMKAMIDLANAYMEFGQPQKGKIAFEAAVASYPNFAPPHMQLGKYYLSQQDFSAALKSYQRAEELTQIPEVYQSMAVCHLKLNQLEEALQNMNEGLAFKPSSVEYYILKSDLHRLLDQKEEAHKELERTLKLFPDNAEAQQKYDDVKLLLEKE